MPDRMSGLHFLWLELTEKCNLECVHCYISSSPKLPLIGAVGPDKWKELILDGFRSGCREIQFIGGEATMYPALPELLTYAHGLGYEFIEVFTNAVSFNSKIRRVFVETNIHLAFSFYSIDHAIHDKITKVPGSQVKTLQNVRWALAQGLRVRANVVRTPENEHCADDAVAFLSELGVTNIQNNRTLHSGRGAEFVQGHAIEDKLCGSCWRGSLFIATNGNVYACPLSRDNVVGHVNDGLEAIVNSQNLVNFRKDVYNYFSALQEAAGATNCTDPCTCLCICTCTCMCEGCMCMNPPNPRDPNEIGVAESA